MSDQDILGNLVISPEGLVLCIEKGRYLWKPLENTNLENAFMFWSNSLKTLGEYLYFMEAAGYPGLKDISVTGCSFLEMKCSRGEYYLG